MCLCFLCVCVRAHVCMFVEEGRTNIECVRYHCCGIKEESYRRGR